MDTCTYCQGPEHEKGWHCTCDCDLHLIEGYSRTACPDAVCHCEDGCTHNSSCGGFGHLFHQTEDCGLVAKRIACSSCHYPVSEARFPDIDSYLQCVFRS